MTKIQEAWLRLAACITAKTAEEFNAAYPGNKKRAGRKVKENQLYKIVSKTYQRKERK